MAETNIEADITDREDLSVSFGVRAGGEDIGEMAIYEDRAAHIDWVSSGEEINNGFLVPAQLAVARCYMLDRLQNGLPPVKVRNLDDEVIVNSHNYRRLRRNRQRPQAT